jgi:hypothetical protein
MRSRKAVLYLSTNSREQELGRALATGFNQLNVTCEPKTRSDFWETGIDPDADIVAFVGVKSKKIFEVCNQLGKLPLLIDKGYFGRGDYYRMSFGSYQPTYLHRYLNWTSHRFNKCVPSGVQMRRFADEAVMYVGSSQKYCNFHNLGDCNDYARNTLLDMRKHWDSKIIYRPKPSWFAKSKSGERREKFEEAPIRAEFSHPDRNFHQELSRCWAIVTHGSNGAAEALAYGVPVVMLSQEGVSPVYELCEHSLARINKPYFSPFLGVRQQLLSAMAWCQFTIDEIRTGYAWSTILEGYGTFIEVER